MITEKKPLEQIKNFANKKLLQHFGLEIRRTKSTGGSGFYYQDRLCTNHNHDFMHEPRFHSAYERGIKACDEDYHFHWRVHVALWVASQALPLEGDFVECGVNRGFLSSAIMNYLDWNMQDKKFYLFDTFQGLDPETCSEAQYLAYKIHYPECFERVEQNFKEYQNVHIIRGSVPDTLSDVNISSVAYLSIDMNCVIPEIAAANFFWSKLVDGGFILLDDYGFHGHEEQKLAFQDFAKGKNIEILSLPTGQGLMMKPNAKRPC